MRQLLSGIAVAALLAAGLPAIARAAADHATSGATMAPESTDQTVKAKPAHKRSAAAAPGRHTTAADDNVAEQLNQQELQQLGQAPANAPTSTGSSVPPRQ